MVDKILLLGLYDLGRLCSFIASAFMVQFEVAIFGLESSTPLSLVGIIVVGIALLNGVTGYALWTGKDWAINLGIATAYAGIILCVITMLLSAPGQFTFRLEIIALVIFLNKLHKIKTTWDKLSY